MYPELRPTTSNTANPVLQSALEHLNGAEFAELDAMLDALPTPGPRRRRDGSFARASWRR